MTDETKTALLSKLRAPVADERAAFEADWRGSSDLAKDPLTGAFTHPDTQKRWAGWLSRAALASAPVAGEAQEPVGEVFRHGEGRDENGPRVGIRMLPAAAGLPHGPQVYAAPQASEAECSCPSGNGSLRHPCAVHPQASEAVRDALEMLIREAQNVADDHHRPRYTRLDEAIQSARAALSAQPGAQKGCNCGTCRPLSVEMRMILCEVCGDKRCPHAADHRNECTSQPKQHNDGGAE